MRSADLVAALGTELCCNFEFRTAARALVLGAQRLAAFGAEFRSLRARSARGTQRGGLAGQVEILSEILRLDLDLHLVDRGLRLLGGELDFEVGRAVEAECAVLIPARTQACPVRTLWTLAEIRLGFVDGSAKGLVVRGALNGTLDFIRGVACLSEESAEQAAGGSKRAARHPRGGGLELGGESVAAAVAEKFELKSLVGGEVVVVSSELDEWHGSSGEF